MVKEFDLDFNGKQIKIVQLDNGKFKVPTFVNELEGMFGGSQLKPAVEIILVAMKPCCENTFVEQALVNGHGGTWFGNCRIPYASEQDKLDINQDRGFISSSGKEGNVYEMGLSGKHSMPPSSDGRFPANLLVSDNVLDNGEITKSTTTTTKYGFGGNKEIYGERPNSLEALNNERGYDDVGGFSRYFSLDAWWEQQIKSMPKAMREPLQKTFPFIIEPKASQGEKNEGCEELEPKYMDESREVGSAGGTNPRNRGAESQRNNFHPTVKPVDLMSYLVVLGSKKGEVVLDPFVGSGTTCIASELMNRNSIGIELNKEYFNIAEARVKQYQQQTKLNSFS